MNKARRRLQKQRRARRKWNEKHSFGGRAAVTQSEILKTTAEKGVQHGWSTNLDGKTPKPRARKVKSGHL